METNYLPKNLAFSILSLVLISFATYAQVGIGTTDPKTELDVNGALSLRTGGNLSLNAGANNNVSLGATPYSFYRVAASNSNFTINSIVTSSAGATDGQIITLENNSTGTMTLAHNGGGTNRNRILCPGGRNLTLSGRYATATLMYETNHNRWVVTSYADSRYGDNIQSSIGTTDTNIYAYTDIAPFTAMSEMSITFIPKHSIVYLNFSTSGYASPTFGFFNMTTRPTKVYFRLQNGSTTIANTTSISTDYDDFTGVVTGWNAFFTMYPVTVTPGVSTTLSIEWRAITLLGNNYPSTTNPVIYCNPTGTLSHKSLTIFD